jgi:carboxypeptidase C (cathepsin A)
MRHSTLFAAVCCLLSSAAHSQDTAQAPTEESQELESVARRRFEANIGGESFSYQTVAGRYLMETEEGAPKARIFYTAYLKEGVEDPASRPLTFCFNGGPGSSSVWLHMGVLGPKRVEMGADGEALPPPYRLVDNAESILDDTDLVFIDPVMTGYSRPAKGEAREQFHGLREDINSVAEFIRLYTTREERWASPKFLAGESYGTTRAAGLAGALQNEHGMYLNGLILISSILDFQTARFQPGNDLPYVLFLPTYAATAFYHGQLEEELSSDLRATLDEVEVFARGDYAHALMLGDDLEPKEQLRIAGTLSRYTGLEAEYLLACNLRPGIFRFTKELLRGERKTVGRLDSRFVGYDSNAAGESPDYDPSYAAIQGSFTAVVNDYLRRELGYENDLPYEILTGRVHPWSYAEFENGYVNVSQTLREAMTKNPDLRVYVANGYYDLATPYFATEYTFDHLGLEPHLRSHVTMGWFEAGHMMYIHEPSRRAFKAQVSQFLRASGGPR